MESLKPLLEQFTSITIINHIISSIYQEFSILLWSQYISDPRLRNKNSSKIIPLIK
jgi:hypothetical protein